VIRGGSWNNNAENCTAANRNRNEPGNANNNVGFRLLAAPPAPGQRRRNRPAFLLHAATAWTNASVPRLVLVARANAPGAAFSSGESVVAKTFDATLKDMGRESAPGILAAFDQPPRLPLKLLNVDLSTVTTAADVIVGLGDPLEEIIHLEFQSSAAAWKHADLMVHNALLYAHYHVPVHTLILLLRPEAAHANLNGTIVYAPRPGRGKMDFSYEIVPLWERPAEELLAADLGVTPLAMLGQLPETLPLEDGLRAVAQQVVERITKEAAPDRAKKLLTDALLLTGLRVRRDVAARIFRGVRVMQESDTYLMILEEGQEKQAKTGILLVGEERLGPADETVKVHLQGIHDLDHLNRMLRRAAKASRWQEIVDTP
jgi:hypothetical protein